MPKHINDTASRDEAHETKADLRNYYDLKWALNKIRNDPNFQNKLNLDRGESFWGIKNGKVGKVEDAKYVGAKEDVMEELTERDIAESHIDAQYADDEETFNLSPRL